MGTAFISKGFLTDANGNLHATFEGAMQWIVNPQGWNSTRIIYGTFTASRPLF
jgi:hypothetical protein